MEDAHLDSFTGSESSSVGDWPLHRLVGNDEYFDEVDKKLLDSDSPDERDESGFTLLHAASWSHHANPRILQLLLEEDADVDSTARHNYTPLHFAVANRKRIAVHLLLEAEANVNSRDTFGRTALHFAIGTNWSYPLNPLFNPRFDMWILEKLLSHPDAKIDQVDGRGETPVMWAVNGGNSEALAALLRSGADPNIPNRRKQTPLHVALTLGEPREGILCVLLDHGARIYCKDKFGRTPFRLFTPTRPALKVAQHTLWYIALRYKLKKRHVCALKRVPELYDYLNKCHDEVEEMKKHVLYDNLTLHDFACDCFHLNVEDPLQTIYIPVVRILLSGSYIEYLDFILKRMTKRDLSGILRLIIPAVGDLYVNAEHMATFMMIKIFYPCNPV